MTAEPLVAPLRVSEGPLPPHDLELYDSGGRVIARWDGGLLDELGSREQMTASLNAVADAFNAPRENAFADRHHHGENPDCGYCKDIRVLMLGHGDLMLRHGVRTTVGKGWWRTGHIAAHIYDDDEAVLTFRADCPRCVEERA